MITNKQKKQLDEMFRLCQRATDHRDWSHPVDKISITLR